MIRLTRSCFGVSPPQQKNAEAATTIALLREKAARPLYFLAF